MRHADGRGPAQARLETLVDSDSRIRTPLALTDAQLTRVETFFRWRPAHRA
jgi:hypothetical protein